MMPDERRVQTNPKLSAESAAEHKGTAQIMEEALRLHEELTGSEYRDMIKAALTVRFSDNLEDRLAAIESLRDDIRGATPDGSVSIEAAIARMHARRL